MRMPKPWRSRSDWQAGPRRRWGSCGVSCVPVSAAACGRSWRPSQRPSGIARAQGRCRRLHLRVRTRDDLAEMFICRVGAIHKRLAARESASSPASRGRISLALGKRKLVRCPHDQEASTNRRCLELSRLMRKRNQGEFPCIAIAAHPRVPRPLRRHRGAPRPELMAGGMAH